MRSPLSPSFYESRILCSSRRRKGRRSHSRAPAVYFGRMCTLRRLPRQHQKIVDLVSRTRYHLIMRPVDDGEGPPPEVLEEWKRQGIDLWKCDRKRFAMFGLVIDNVVKIHRDPLSVDLDDAVIVWPDDDTMH